MSASAAAVGVAEPSSPRARRATGASLLPLTLLIVGFFLPTLRGCDHMETPAENLVQSADLAVFLYPYLLAAGLAALIAVAFAVGPSGPVRKAALVLGGLPIALAPLGALVLLEHPKGPDVALLAGGAVLVAIAARSWNRARRRAGWESWPPLLLAFALGSSCAQLTALLGKGIAEDQLHLIPDLPRQADVGAYVYMGALALLVLIGAVGSARDQSV